MFDPGHAGIVIGLVTDLDDPERLGRVQVRFPYLGDRRSDWAKLVSPMAGPDRGMFFRPEVDDEVLVAFEHGDPRRSYILGSVWSKVDRPPSDDGQPVQNNWRFIRSRSGHIFKLDDTAGRERVEVIDKNGRCKVIVDSAADKIQVVADTGGIELSAPIGTITIDAAQVEINATASMTLKAGATLTLSGLTVSINP